MRSSPALRGALAIAALAVACRSGENLLLPSEQVPTALQATATSPTSVRIEWDPIAEPSGEAQVVGYRLERRADLQGPFKAVLPTVPASGDRIVAVDESVEPDRFYGYRVRAVSRLGEVSAASIIVGVRTPPPPGIEVTVELRGFTASIDALALELEGPERRSAPVVANGPRRFAPLPNGEYRVILRGTPGNCRVPDDTLRVARVDPIGVNTLARVPFLVDCRDPSRGDVVAAVEVGGDDRPAAVSVRLEGTVPSAPPGEQAVSRVQTIGSAGGGAVLFAGLRPATYTVEVETPPSNCEVTPAGRRQDVTVSALGSDTVRFAVACADTSGGGGEDPSRPLVLRSAFTPAAAAQGQTVSLEVALDLRAAPGEDVNTLGATLSYNPAVLEFVSLGAATPEWSTFAGTPQGGVLTWGAFTTTSGLTGLVPIARLTFRVLGGSGSTRPRLTVTDATTSAFEDLRDQIRVDDGTLTIGGTGSNAPPTAQAGGPYVGVAGTPVILDGRGSTDPDGEIVGYAWDFGDGTTGTGAQPTKSWTAAGSYVVTLTVTDDGGATAAAATTATISGGGSGANQPPVARPGGPYTGTAGQPIPFSALASSDPDGVITSYSWSFGDGTTANGPTPSKAYAAPGSYTARLTVTDDRGAQAFADAAVTVAPADGGGQAIVLRNVFQAGTVAGTIDLLVYLDLSVDLPQTAGPETLQAWALSLLQWNERVLRYRSFNTGNGWSAVIPQLSGTDATTGLRTLSVPLTQYQGSGANRSGLVLLARIGFDVVGAPGTSTTTLTAPGALLAPGGFSYGPLTQVVEATYTRP